MTDSGRKLIVMIHEVGGLGGFHYVTTHQDDVSGIAFYETWIDVCPDSLEGGPANPAPPAGDGVCQKDTLVPFDLWSLWETVIYPSEAATCAFFTPLLVDPATVQGFTFRTLSDDLLDAYFAPYTVTPDCSQIPGPLNFPRNIPVPVAGEPAPSRKLYDDLRRRAKELGRAQAHGGRRSRGLRGGAPRAGDLRREPIPVSDRRLHRAGRPLRTGGRTPSTWHTSSSPGPKRRACSSPEPFCRGRSAAFKSSEAPRHSSRRRLPVSSS